MNKCLGLVLLCTFLCTPISGISQKRKKQKKDKGYRNVGLDYNAKIKAVFLYNFTKYIEWPSDRQTGEFSIGIVGENDKLKEELDIMSKVRKVANRPFKIYSINSISQISDQHILYIPKGSSIGLKNVLTKVEDKSILIVTEEPGLAIQGSAINFIIVGNRQKFEINVQEFKKRGLLVAKALAELAIVVGPSKDKWLAKNAISDKTKISNNLSDEEFDSLFIKMQQDLAFEKTKNATKDKKIEALQKNVNQLESSILLKETELGIVQGKIKDQSIELERISSSIGLKEQEYLDNKRLAEESKNDLENARKTLQETQRQLNKELEEAKQILQKTKSELNKDLEATAQSLQKTKAELKNTSYLLSNQKLITYLMLFVLLVIAGLGIVAYKNFKKQKLQANVISKQKIIAESQRDEIHLQHAQLEEQNKEITDSINYAKRIQEAILPPLKLVKSFLNDSFIFYQPKDIVAGDFYWMETIGEQVIFAAADCTGHGVPGAMVSVVCSNALNRSVREFELIEPAKILDKTLEIVLERFEKSEKEVKDGMDIALCSYNLKTQELQFAGAQNPIWIIRKDSVEIEEIKGDKQPIGRFARHQAFTNHYIQLNKGDSTYLSSDGYIDQFGGEKGKKFMSLNFKRLLLSINKESMKDQNKIIQQTFNDWKGDLEQLDDVCVMGFKV